MSWVKNCSNLIYMYHTNGEHDCTRSVDAVIYVPPGVWKNSSKEIHSIVEDSFNKINLALEFLLQI